MSTPLDHKQHLELSYRSINCFAEDGKLNLDKLDQLLDMALTDERTNNNERLVLDNIIKQLSHDELTPSMLVRAAELKTQLQN